MIRAGFLRSVALHPDRPALEVGEHTLTYRALDTFARRIAATLAREVTSPRQPLTAVFAQRSPTAYAGVLGALYRGHGYVPMNPDFPVDRLGGMLQRAEVDAVIVDAQGLPKLVELLRFADHPLVVIVPEPLEGLPTVPAPHRLVSADALAEAASDPLPPLEPDAIANLLFTSGSTGQPKGVMVAQRNLVYFIERVLERYTLGPEDRFSQLFELVFDLSGFDMFAAWWVGACVCCPTKAQMLTAGQFVHDARLTVWFSVPSTAVLMKRLGFLEPGALPNLRVSLFCGEALPADVTRAWAEAAPQSVVENLYGPTELTLACTWYTWHPERSPAECENGLVPIGEAFPGMSARVVNADLVEVAPGELGELLMAGPQVTLGYWRDAEKTEAAFVVPPGTSAVHYRTGDLVRRAVGGAPMTFQGRADTQIKVRGYRIELGEVEAAIRAEARTDFAVALGWPKNDAGYDGIVGFVAGVSADPKTLKAAVAKRLPAYFGLSRVHVLPEFPLNVNGKVDRKALGRMLEEGFRG
jgi:amino acid adenylation domain-containing protein